MMNQSKVLIVGKSISKEYDNFTTSVRGDGRRTNEENSEEIL